MVGGGRPLLPEILGRASAVTPSEKVQLTLTGSPLLAFE